MTSVSMALAGLGFPIYGYPANPALLNAWLIYMKGYECLDGDCNNLVLAAPTWLDTGLELVGEIPTPPAASIRAGLSSGEFIYVAHVRNRSHFVLLTGFDAQTPSGFIVNDPYNYSRLAGAWGGAAL